MKNDRAEVAVGVPAHMTSRGRPGLQESVGIWPGLYPNEFALTLLVFIDNWFVIVDSAQNCAELSADHPLESN